MVSRDPSLSAKRRRRTRLRFLRTGPLVFFVTMAGLVAISLSLPGRAELPEEYDEIMLSVSGMHCGVW